MIKKLVADAARAQESYGADELEAHAEYMKRNVKHSRCTNCGANRIGFFAECPGCHSIDMTYLYKQCGMLTTPERDWT